MSARKRRLTIDEETELDIADALLWTRQRWGVDQRKRYRGILYRAMRSLLDYPELGVARDEVFSGCRALFVERHVIFYEIADGEIIVLRVLHAHQLPTGRVRPD